MFVKGCDDMSVHTGLGGRSEPQTMTGVAFKDMNHLVH
jgi:hypothetical protein